jgi:hypothetical protein
MALSSAEGLQVNQVYNERFRFAGDRVWSAPYAQEVWAKPLMNNEVAVRCDHT